MMNAIARQPAAAARARNRAAPTPAIKPGLTPGGYMHECRSRAGISIAACARAIALRGDGQIAAQHKLAALEANRPGDYGRLVRALRDFAVFPFDFGVFVALAAATADPSLPGVDE